MLVLYPSPRKDINLGRTIYDLLLISSSKRKWKEEKVAYILCYIVSCFSVPVLSSRYLKEAAKVPASACASQDRAMRPSTLGVTGVLLTELGTKHLSSHAVGNVSLVHGSRHFPSSVCSNTLRVTRSAAPTSLDGSAIGGPAQLGKKGKDFDFSQLPMKVEFVECSARGSKGEEGDADFEGLEKWLAKIA